MTWRAEVYIGEMRPWPDAVDVVRGRTGEAAEYVPGRTCHVEAFDDGMDEALDGGITSYSPPMWYLSCSHTSEGMERPSYCPDCGARVEP